MRVAVVVERLDPGGGGVEGAAFHLVNALAERGTRVSAVCREASGSPPGVEVLRLGGPSFWQPLRLAAFSRRAARATRASPRSFDVVHAFSRTRHQDVYRAGGGSHAAYMERVYPRPWLTRWSPRHRTILHIEEAVFRDRDQIIQCNSQRVADEIAARYDVAGERLAVIYNGVDTDRFHPRRRETDGALLRQKLGLKDAVALFVGSGFARKGLDRAIDGLARAAPEAALLVAGADDPAPWQRLAEQRGVGRRVRFLGQRRDVEALYAAADLFVLPTRYDPFANACLEAMASGLPVATTRANGVADLIEDGRNGFLLDDDFAPAFARLGDHTALAGVGGEARRTAEPLTWARHTDEVLALYARIVERRA